MTHRFQRIRPLGGRGHRRPARRPSTPRSITSAASTRRGSSARTARKMPANPRPSARSRSIRAGRRRSRTSRAAATWWCSIGWTGRAATSSSRCRGITASQRGTFSLRSPARPNPIAMSVVRLLKVEGNTLVGGGPRLPRRHAAPRPQALFRLDRCRARCGGRLAQGAQELAAQAARPRV